LKRASQIRSSSVKCILLIYSAICYGAVVAMETAQVALDLYQAIQT